MTVEQIKITVEQIKAEILLAGKTLAGLQRLLETKRQSELSKRLTFGDLKIGDRYYRLEDEYVDADGDLARRVKRMKVSDAAAVWISDSGQIQFFKYPGRDRLVVHTNSDGQEISRIKNEIPLIS